MKSKEIRRRVLVAFSAFAVAIGCLLAPVSANAMEKVQKTADVCSSAMGKNAGAQNYGTWSKVMKSYLAQVGNTYLRVQSETDGILVEYYDTSFNLLASKKIASELPLFGGFYASSDSYYIVSGQTNKAENNSTEVYRITKYDKNWNRVGSDGLYGANTTVPFDAGSCRITECGDYILVRTCHEMYTSSDGRNHQANVTIEFNKNTAKITDSYYSVMNSSYGYVSHSFNQFIKVENNKIVAVDHGDAYPRSIALLLYNSDCSTGRFSGRSCSVYNFIEFQGSTGDNYTGASVGGFEITDSSYMIAGNQAANYSNGNLRDIFVSTINKSSKAVKTTKLTNVTATGTTASTPQLVKISGNKLMVLWTEGSQVCYALVDGNGNKLTNTQSFGGALSDCAPIVSNGKVIWYVSEGEIISFYEINVNDMGVKETDVKVGHNYVYDSTQGDYATIKCSKCGNSVQKEVPTSLSVMYLTSEPGSSYKSYSSWTDTDRESGTEQYFKAYTNLDSLWGEDNPYVYAKSSDTSVAKVSGDKIQFINPGTVTITFGIELNPSLTKTKTFTVGGDVTDPNATNDAGNNNDNNAGNNSGNNSGSSNGGFDFDSWLNNFNNSFEDLWNSTNNNNNNSTNNTNGNSGSLNNFNKKNGLYSVNGEKYLYANDKIDTSYTGLYNDITMGWWLVVNGKVATNYNDLYGDANYGWWKIAGGAVDFGYTGLYGSPTCGWWLINNGRVAFEYSDLYGDANYGWWKVNGGAVDFGYTGLYGSPTCGWWLIGGGQVAFYYNDLWGDPNYGWWKVVGGAVDFGYNGWYESPNYGWWNIYGGAVVF